VRRTQADRTMQPSSTDRFFQSRGMAAQEHGDLLGSIVARSQAALHKAASLEHRADLKEFCRGTSANKITKTTAALLHVVRHGFALPLVSYMELGYALIAVSFSNRAWLLQHRAQPIGKREHFTARRSHASQLMAKPIRDQLQPLWFSLEHPTLRIVLSRSLRAASIPRSIRIHVAHRSLRSSYAFVEALS
jgi:hypothetical protein